MTIRLLTVLVASVMLAACEMPEKTQKRTERDQDQDRPEWTRLTRTDDWVERWAGIAAGYSSRARSGRLAAALGLDPDDLPDWFKPRNGRQYGACSVFDLVIPAGTVDLGRVIEEDYTLHFLDCVGEPGPDTTLEGLYHLAPLCSFHHRALVMRAGLQSHQAGERISTWYRIGGMTVDMVYPGEELPRANWVEDATLNGKLVPIRWALADGFEERCYEDIHGHCEGEYDGLSARIPTSPTMLECAVGGIVGKVTLESNDHLASTEFEKRCEVLWRTHQ